MPYELFQVPVVERSEEKSDEPGTILHREIKYSDRVEDASGFIAQPGGNDRFFAVFADSDQSALDGVAAESDVQTVDANTMRQRAQDSGNANPDAVPGSFIPHPFR